MKSIEVIYKTTTKPQVLFSQLNSSCNNCNHKLGKRACNLLSSNSQADPTGPPTNP